MARPGDIANLTGWWEAYLEADYVHDDPVDTFHDQTANDDLTESATQRPTFKVASAPSGVPALYFDGSNDRLQSSKNLTAFLTGSAGTVMLVAKILSATLDNADPLNNQGLWSDSVAGGNLGMSVKAGAPTITGYNTDSGGLDQVDVGFTFGEWAIYSWRHSSGQLYVSVNGGAESNVASGAAVTLANPFQLGRSNTGSTKYLEMLLGGLAMWDVSLGASDWQSMVDYFRAAYALGSIVSPRDQCRQLVSTKLRRRRRRAARIFVTVPLHVGLDLALGDTVKISHPDLPSPDGLGAGLADGSAWQGILDRRRLREDHLVDLELIHDRLMRVLLWEGGRTTVPGDRANGVARITPGPKLAFTRNATQYVRNPGDVDQGIAILSGQPAYDFYGLALEGADTNFVKDSSGNYITTWTPSGLLQATTDILFFDSELIPAGCRMVDVSGTPAYITATTDPLTGVQHTRFLLIYQTSDGAAIGWRLQRSSDSWYWNDSTPGWQSGAVTNEFTPAAANEITWGVSEPIDLGATGLTATIRITTTAVDQGVRPFHVQLGANRYAGSPIITSGAAVTRAANCYSLANGLASGLQSCWWPTRGTALLRARWLWDAADMPADAIIAKTVYSAGHGFTWRWDGAAGEIKLDVDVGGTTYTASIAHTPVRGTRDVLAARWASSVGELGLTPYQIDVFLNGVQGTPDVLSGPPTEAAATWYLGSDAGADPIAAYVTDVWVSPYVWRQEEIARWPG